MSTECNILENSLVPIYKVVNAAIIDTYEDMGKVQERATHLAARGLRKLNRESLKLGKKKVILHVNRSTNTATLPMDFREETFVGLMSSSGTKIPLRLRPELIDEKGTEDIECEDKCLKCDQNKSICNDLTITEDTTLVVIEGNTYEQTIIKKLYPNGDYFLESRIPMWDIENETVIYTTTKKFITALDLKPCGCIEETEENIEKIKCCCFDVYCAYFSPCEPSCDPDHGGYRVFEETGLIQFDKIGKFTKVYMEYWGFMPKKNGQYMVPEVAFDAIVEYIKFMLIDGKRNISNADKNWRWQRYVTEKANMEKILGRISLSQIIQAINLIPKFDLELSPPIGVYGLPCPPSVTPTPTTDDCTTTSTVCPPSSSSGGAGSAASYIPFTVSGISGNGGLEDPTPGLFTFQSDKLIGAVGVNFIVVNNANETLKGGQFSLDTVTGILTRTNQWFEGDTWVVPAFYKLLS
jgi:hypothetical protein